MAWKRDTSFSPLSFGKPGSSLTGLGVGTNGAWGIELLGVVEMANRLNRELPEAISIGIQLAYGKMSQHVLNLAQKYVPVSFGKLKETGRVFGGGGALLGKMSTLVGNVTPTNGIISGGIVYGSPSVPYASYVHNRTDLRHGQEWNAYYTSTDDASARSYLNSLRRHGGKLSRNPEERALWIQEALTEAAPDVHAMLSAGVWNAITRVCKNPLRYGVPRGNVTVNELRKMARKAGKY